MARDYDIEGGEKQLREEINELNDEIDDCNMRLE